MKAWWNWIGRFISYFGSNFSLEVLSYGKFWHFLGHFGCLRLRLYQYLSSFLTSLALAFPVKNWCSLTWWFTQFADSLHRNCIRKSLMILSFNGIPRSGYLSLLVDSEWPSLSRSAAPELANFSLESWNYSSASSVISSWTDLNFWDDVSSFDHLRLLGESFDLELSFMLFPICFCLVSFALRWASFRFSSFNAIFIQWLGSPKAISVPWTKVAFTSRMIWILGPLSDSSSSQRKHSSNSYLTSSKAMSSSTLFALVDD